MSSLDRDNYYQQNQQQQQHVEPEFNLFGNSRNSKPKTTTTIGNNNNSNSDNNGIFTKATPGAWSFNNSPIDPSANHSTHASPFDLKPNGNSSSFNSSFSTSARPSRTSGGNLLNSWTRDRIGQTASAANSFRPFKDLPDHSSSSSSKLNNLVPPSRNLVIDDASTKPNLFDLQPDSNGGVGGAKMTKQEVVKPQEQQRPWSRLGQLFSLFSKKDDKEKKKNKKDGTTRSKVSYHTPNTITPRGLSTPSYKAVDIRRTGHMKRLVLKSKPVKYHLIDVNKVLSSRRNKVVTYTKSAEHLLKNEDSDIDIDDDDDDDDDHDEIENVKEESQRKVFSKQTFDVPDIKGKKDKGKEEETMVEPKKGQETDFESRVSDAGYWTSPSIEELAGLSENELSNVENFIIGRVKYGQIAYDYPVDLSKVKREAELKNIPFSEQLFENTVQFQPQTILTYKNETHKPSLGTELNVPATITLEGIVNGKPSLHEQIEFLKSQTGMEYISYNPKTLTWVFRVKHFSIWGLVDADDEKQKDLVTLKRKQDAKEAEALLEYSRIYESEDINQELKKQKLNEDAKIVPGGWKYPTTSVVGNDILDLKRELVNREIEQELSRFSDSEAVDLSGKVDGINIDDSDVGEEPEEEEDVEETKINVYEPIIEDESVFNKIRNDLVVSTASNWLLQLELANQFDSAFSPLAVEADQSKEKLTFSKVDDILFSDFNNKPRQVSNSELFAPVFEAADDEQALFDDGILLLFEKILGNCASLSTTRKNGIPKLAPKADLTFAELQPSAGSAGADDMQIDLASILFDDNGPPSKKNEQQQQQQLHKFAQWLKQYNQFSVSDLLKRHKFDYLECALVCLVTNDTVRAIEFALKSGSEHLAVILTLANARSSVVEKSAREQLQKWKQIDSKLVPSAIVKIYQILARDLTSLSQKLPWNLAIGLNLFFGDFTDLKSLVSEFEAVLPGKDAVAEMLKIFISNEFQVAKLSQSALPMKMQWLLCLVLAKSDYDNITRAFGSQLESSGFWIESLVVYSSMANDEQAHQHIKGVLIKKIGQVHQLTNVEEKYLVDNLKVPQSLIYEAMAIERRKRRDYWGEADLLILNSKWEDVHNTIVTELGPDAAISCSSWDINKLTAVFHKIPENGLIVSQWNKGAGIYENFFALRRNNKDSEVINFLIDHLPLTTPKSKKEKLALNLVGKFVGDLALENDKIGDPKRKKILEFPLDEVNRSYFSLRLNQARK
ncbi:uncharacterized protein LODBEIA_P39840 [Lodderomyces beijingensis]|uniref:Peptidase S59 domain-containing protein n=1 Tax=Lodderomyces beijingensis TaxID=1775926 RepID=A0ABP0ZNM7_9ASCO